MAVKAWVADYYGAQLKAPAAVFQLCLAHQLRDWHRLLDATPEEQWGAAVQKLFRGAIHLGNRFLSGERLVFFTTRKYHRRIMNQRRLCVRAWCIGRSPMASARHGGRKPTPLCRFVLLYLRRDRDSPSLIPLPPYDDVERFDIDPVAGQRHVFIDTSNSRFRNFALTHPCEINGLAETRQGDSSHRLNETV